MADLFGNVEPDRYPDVPGHRGIETSIEAAEAVAPHCGRLQRLVLETITERGALGATADEVADLLAQSRWSVQPRTSELRQRKLIVDSGLRRHNSTGKRAIVWCLPQHKQEAAQ